MSIIRIRAWSPAEWQGRILLCRRAIEPRRGFWTLPAGFMENHETTAQGALRETLSHYFADRRAGQFTVHTGDLGPGDWQRHRS